MPPLACFVLLCNQPSRRVLMWHPGRKAAPSNNTTLSSSNALQITFMHTVWSGHAYSVHLARVLEKSTSGVFAKFTCVSDGPYRWYQCSLCLRVMQVVQSSLIHCSALYTPLISWSMFLPWGLHLWQSLEVGQVLGLSQPLYNGNSVDTIML